MEAASKAMKARSLRSFFGLSFAELIVCWHRSLLGAREQAFVSRSTGEAAAKVEAGRADIMGQGRRGKKQMRDKKKKKLDIDGFICFSLCDFKVFLAFVSCCL